MKIFKTELEAWEAGESVKANNNFTWKPAPSNNAPHKVSGTPSTLLSNHDQKCQSIENFTIRCVYCKELHYSGSCKRVTNLQKHIEILQRKNRFFVCLSFGHRGHECWSTKTCHNCKQRHHQINLWRIQYAVKHRYYCSSDWRKDTRQLWSDH